MPSILFVCLANVCRSPAAEGFLRHMATKETLPFAVHVESCGIGDWNLGQLPDERMRQASQSRGVILASRAQKFQMTFLDKFDLILAADNHVLNHLYRYAEAPDHKAKIHLITHFSSCYPGEEIPDPYYQGEAGFEHVLDMIEDSCRGIIDHLGK